VTSPSVNEIVDRLVGAGFPEVSRIEGTLAVTFRQTDQNPYWTFYQADLSDGPFARADFRLSRDGARALLSLWTDAPKAPGEKDLDLDRWGPIASIDVNPDIRPEGTDAYIFEVQGVRVSFQLTHASRRLRSVALEWGISHLS
jgi:hypothetical protein